MNDVILMAVDARSTDLVRSDDGTLYLLELELVEPELFFRLDASLGECLAAHLQRLVGRRDDD